jgi:hypothetical protein
MTNPPLRPLHPDSSLSPSGLDYWRKKPTQEIIDSLRPGGAEPLMAKPDGTMINGHHRIKVLRERGVDVDGLPREVYAPDTSTFPDPP